MTLLGLRTSYSVKHWLVLVLIIVDLALNTMIDSASDRVPVLAMMGAQGVCRILTLFVVFLFMWNTFVFKYGLLGALCQRFKLLFLIYPVAFVFLVAVRIYRGVSRSNRASEAEAGWTGVHSCADTDSCCSVGCFLCVSPVRLRCWTTRA